MKTGAKMPWSQATRARMVAFADRRFTLFCRNLNQVAAAGPKMTTTREGETVSKFLPWGKGGMGAELTSAVEGHPAGPGKLMLLDALLLNELLGHDIANAKEYRCGHGLGEQRARRQPCLVPVWERLISSLS
jgi:hypothetical protein